MQYQTVYQAGAAKEFVLWLMVAGFVLMVAKLWHGIQRPLTNDYLDEDWTKYALQVVGFLIFATALPLLAWKAWSDTFGDRLRLANRDYAVVVGEASRVFHDTTNRGGVNTSFSINGQRFGFYDDAGRSRKHVVENSGNIFEGTPVRFAHHEGKILKLDIGYEAGTGRPTLSDGDVIELVTSAMGLGGSPRQTCVRFDLNRAYRPRAESQPMVEVTVRERHDRSQCAPDPGHSIVVGEYTVDPRNGQIWIRNGFTGKESICQPQDKLKAICPTPTSR